MDKISPPVWFERWLFWVVSGRKYWLTLYFIYLTVVDISDNFLLISQPTFCFQMPGFGLPPPFMFPPPFMMPPFMFGESLTVPMEACSGQKSFTVNLLLKFEWSFEIYMSVLNIASEISEFCRNFPSLLMV